MTIGAVASPRLAIRTLRASGGVGFDIAVGGVSLDAPIDDEEPDWGFPLAPNIGSGLSAIKVTP